MKFICGRATDTRDVFMLMPLAENKEWIKEELTKFSNFKDCCQKIKKKILLPQFKQNLEGVYGYIDQKVFKKHKEAILTFMKK